MRLPRAGAGSGLLTVPWLLGHVLLGTATSLGTIAFHTSWIGLVLAAFATLTTLLAARAGWRRSGYAAGWLIVLVAAVMGRPEGDWAVAGNPSGYVLLTLALVVAGVAVATLPKPRSRAVRSSVESGNPQPST